MPGPFHDFLLSQHQALGNSGKFQGNSTIPYADFSGSLLASYSARRVFDFGSGVGLEDQELHAGHRAIRKRLPVPCEIIGYEPSKQKDNCVFELNQLITASPDSFNAVLSFDVLEHLDFYDSALIVPELFRIAQDVVIVNVSCIPAAKSLPNGKNAHTSIMSHSTWAMMFWQEALRTGKHFALFCTVSESQDAFIHNIPVERCQEAFKDSNFCLPSEHQGVTIRVKFSHDAFNLSEPMNHADRWLRSHIAHVLKYKD